MRAWITWGVLLLAACAALVLAVPWCGSVAP